MVLEGAMNAVASETKQRAKVQEQHHFPGCNAITAGNMGVLPFVWQDGSGQN